MTIPFSPEPTNDAPQLTLITLATSSSSEGRTESEVVLECDEDAALLLSSVLNMSGGLLVPLSRLLYSPLVSSPPLSLSLSLSHSYSLNLACFMIYDDSLND